jgi:hypothetical protein
MGQWCADGRASLRSDPISISTKAPRASQRLRRGIIRHGNPGLPGARWTCMAGTYSGRATRTCLSSVRRHKSCGRLRIAAASEDASRRYASSEAPLQHAFFRPADRRARPAARIAKATRRRARRLCCAAGISGSARHSPLATPASSQRRSPLQTSSHDKTNVMPPFRRRNGFAVTFSWRRRQSGRAG